MITFDPAVRRKFLDSELGYRRVLEKDETDMDRARAVGGLANSASSFLTMAVECLLVGFDDPARRLAEVARRYVTAAIEENERRPDEPPDGPEALRWHTRALCAWLQDGVQDQAAFDRSVEHKERFLNASPLGRNKTEVSLTLASYVSAGAYAATLSRFAAAGAPPPASLRAIRGEAQMAWVLARHRLGEAYDAAEVRAAADAFLKKKMDTWLIDGHALRAAEWMKIVHWREGGPLSPKDTVLKCYDYLPTAAAAL